MPKSLLLCLLLAFTGCLYAQADTADTIAPPPAYEPTVDISGTWVGELYQDAGGIAEKFEFSMQIRQIGPAVKGTTYVKLGEIWAEMEFSGFEQTNGSWKFTEFKVVRAEKPEALSWCMKRFNLTVDFTVEGLILSGPWWGNSEFGPCIPGSVKLRKKEGRV